MTAAEIASTLGSARREGRNWRCCCPLHGGRSLVLREGEGGRLLVKCWGGCNRLDVLAELRRRGLLSRGTLDYMPPLVAPARRNDAARTAGSFATWRVALAASSTIAQIYLASRGIILTDLPPSLRFHPRCPRPRDDAGNVVPPLTAMVGLVEHVERGPIGVHCTYLRLDGSGNADLPKNNRRACFGCVGGGAVRFGVPRSGDWLAVGEGIETTLSVAVACSMPAWAALSAYGVENLVLPPEATHVVICADNDVNGRGQRAAQKAAQRWIAEGRRVRVALPRTSFDFNDVLIGRAAATINEVNDVVAA